MADRDGIGLVIDCTAGKGHRPYWAKAGGCPACAAEELPLTEEVKEPDPEPGKPRKPPPLRGGLGK